MGIEVLWTSKNLPLTTCMETPFRGGRAASRGRPSRIPTPRRRSARRRARRAARRAYPVLVMAVEEAVVADGRGADEGREGLVAEAAARDRFGDLEIVAEPRGGGALGGEPRARGEPGAERRHVDLAEVVALEDLTEPRGRVR